MPMQSTPEGIARAMQEVGVSAEDVANAIVNAPSELTAASAILQDPALPQVVKLVNELHASTAKDASGASTGEKGIGLRSAVPALEVAVWAKKHKGAAFVIGGLIIVAPVALGYAFGRATRRR